MQASLASGLVDVCLIPEVPFQLEGEHGLVAYLEHLLETRGHVVICIAEGTAQVRCMRVTGSGGGRAAAAGLMQALGKVRAGSWRAPTYTHSCCTWACSGRRWPCLPHQL